MKKASFFFFLILVLELPLSFFALELQTVLQGEYDSLISVLVMQLYLLAASLLYIRITGKRLREDLWVRPYRFSSFWLSILVLIAASPAATWLNLFSQLFVDNEAGNTIYDVSQTIPLWAAVLLIGCLPAVAEELIYRGILLSAFRRYSVIVGIAISSVSFGLMHMNLNQILYAMYLGVLFAFMVEATGSLISTMVLHMLFNTWNTVLLYALPHVYDWLEQYSQSYADAEMEEMMSQTAERSDVLAMLRALVSPAVFGIVIAGLLLSVIARANGRDLHLRALTEKGEQREQTRPINVWLVLGWLYCLVFTIWDLAGGV